MKVFISYAHRDKRLAFQLAEQLSVAGFSVPNVIGEIVPGDNWARELGRALDEADVMVVLLTRGALDSDALRGSIQYGLTSKHFERRLVPVLIDCPTTEAGKDVPWILLQMDPIRMKSASKGFDEVVDRVRQIASQATNASC